MGREAPPPTQLPGQSLDGPQALVGPDRRHLVGGRALGVEVGPEQGEHPGGLLLVARHREHELSGAAVAVVLEPRLEGRAEGRVPGPLPDGREGDRVVAAAKEDLKLVVRRSAHEAGQLPKPGRRRGAHHVEAL